MPQGKVSHVLWINEVADFVGGCEQYIFNTVSLLREQGIRSTLLYDCLQKRFSVDFVRVFDQAFPLADVKNQVLDIRPDVIYIHRVSGREIIRELKQTKVPTARFFHDTKPVCPREHRYTTLRHTTCDKPMGLRCYFPCMGVVNRSDGLLPIRLNLVRTLRSEIKANCALDAFIVASDYMARILVEHGLPSNRVYVNPLYAHPPSDLGTLRREQALLLFVGQLVRSKGVDTLLHAMKLLESPATLTIIGRGRQEKMFRTLAARLGVNSDVRFLGKVPHVGLSEWYAKATCVVLPVRQPESFALVGPEAMRYGTPVIATNIGGVGAWLVNGNTGIAVPPNDAQALAKAIDRLLASEELRETLGQNALQRYNQLFRPESHISALLHTFSTLNEARAS